MEQLHIWGEQIPYNSGRDKKEDMVLTKGIKKLQVVRGLISIFKKDLDKTTKNLDNFTLISDMQIPGGSELYNDVPYLTPHIVEGAKTGVIVVPGGGFCNKSMEDEGHKVAKMLNEHGISAFVLSYRLNPYRDPAPYMDMQRAIRYVRFHAAEYNIDKLGGIGFSAGGYVVGAASMRLKNDHIAVEGYTPDEIDQEEAKLDFMGLLYPVVNFSKSLNMLALLIGDEVYDEKKRAEAIRKFELKNYLEECDIPQFVCYGTKEPLVGVEKYCEELKKYKVKQKIVIIDKAAHGFGIGERNSKFAYWTDEFCNWVKEI